MGMEGPIPPNEAAEGSMLAQFQAGDKAEYWSETYSQWMPAVIRKVNMNESGCITYDLDVKRNAQASRLRPLAPELPPTKSHQSDHLYMVSSAPIRISGETEAPEMRHIPKAPRPSEWHTPTPKATVGQGVADDQQLRGPMLTGAVADAVLSGNAPAPAPHFAVGDQVEYWSESHKIWMEAQVLQVHSDDLYDLNVKNRAQGKRMRLKASPSGGQLAPTVPSVPAPVAVAAPSAAVPQRLPGAAPAAAPGPVLSGPAPGPQVPLSVRGGRAVQLPPGALLGTDGAEHPEEALSPSPSRAANLVSVARTPLNKNGTAGPLVMAGYPRTPSGNGNCVQQQLPPAVTVQVKVGSPTKRGTATTTYTVTSPTAGQVRQAQFHLDGTPHAVAGHASAASPLRARNPAASPVSSQPPVVMGSIDARRQDNLVAVLNAGRSYSATPSANSANAGADNGPMLELGDLQVGMEKFDPTRPNMKSQLLQKLGWPSDSSVTAMQGFRGGLNEGVWFVSSSRAGVKEELVLKLVRCHRIAQNILTEAENVVKVNREYPYAIRDPSIAFPFRIFSCLGPGGVKKNDLIVMRKVRGERLAEFITHKWYSSQLPQLLRVMERIGAQLAEFHSRYGNLQHGDFQPSNIFYDEEGDSAYFIDVGGMGVPTMETDIEHFSKSLNLLSESYGQQLAVDGIRRFEMGYHRAVQERR